MIAHIENGGPVISLKGYGPQMNANYSLLMIFALMLDAIETAEDAVEVNLSLTNVCYIANKKGWKNPFRFGFNSKGLEIYQNGKELRLAFVPCETDIEI